MKSMQSFRPIETPLGIADGRDAIYLHAIRFEDIARTMILDISLNTFLTEKESKDIDFADCQLVFTDVLATKTIELDSWDWSGESSFDEVIDSEWIAQLGGKVTSDYHHYRVQTYDDVIEVVAAAYRFARQNPEPDDAPNSSARSGVGDL